MIFSYRCQFPLKDGVGGPVLGRRVSQPGDPSCQVVLGKFELNIRGKWKQITNWRQVKLGNQVVLNCDSG